MSIFKRKKYWDTRVWGKLDEQSDELDEVVWKYCQTEKFSIVFIFRFYFQ